MHSPIFIVKRFRDIWIRVQTCDGNDFSHKTSKFFYNMLNLQFVMLCFHGHANNGQRINRSALRLHKPNYFEPVAHRARSSPSQAACHRKAYCKHESLHMIPSTSSSFIISLVHVNM
jgi:hypothetical protein